MDSRSLHYILTITEEQSISKAAKKLYVSQPSLSQYVRKLEQNLGAQLFDRTTTPLKLTYAGECYVNMAKKILNLEKQLSREIEDINNFKRGRLTIGIPLYRGRFILPIVLPIFKERFPGIEVIVIEKTSSELEEIAVKGDTDLTIMYLPLNNDELTYEPIFSDEIITAIPQKYIPESFDRNAYEAYDKNYHPRIQLSTLKDCPFILSKPRQRLRQIIDSLFKEDGFKPNIVFESESIETLYKLTVGGMGICIIPHSLIPETTKNLSEIKQTPVYFFSLDKYTATSKWVLAAVYHRDRYLTRAAREFIAVVKEMKDSITPFVEK